MTVVPSGDFDWINDPDIIVREQPAIAVFRNGAGAVVIRQERTWDDDEDVYIVVWPEHAQRLCEAILQASGGHDVRLLPAPRQVNGNGAKAPSLFPELEV